MASLQEGHGDMADNESTKMPLDGVRVLDLSQNSPGPMATMMLADFGADVLHVVRPGLGSLSELYGGDVSADPYITLRFQPHDAVMRNKRSLALNLKTEAGHDIFLRLVAEADVLVEEMRPGKMAALGLDYESLSAANPRLIYCSITGYGQTGPMAGAAGHDLNYLAMSGILDLCRDRSGRPVNPQAALADNGAGSMSAVAGILMALIARQHTGRGQHIDVSLTDSVMYLTTDMYSTALGGGAPSREWRGTLMGDFPHYRVYRCADDKWLSVGALEAPFTEALFDALGRPHFHTLLADRSRWSELETALTTLFASRPRDYWVDLVGERDAGIAPVLSPEEVATHPQTRAREMVVESNGIKQVGITPKLSEMPGRIRTPPAAPGEHSEEILSELGYDENRIAELENRDVTN